jgi:di/tricarboxylate transporter
MSLDIVLVFAILGVALFLFFSGWVRMDVVALLVLGSLAVTGLVTPAEALAGFSNPAVITVWAMFILSAALYQTGVARILGRHVLRLAGHSETGLVVTIMLTSGFLSAFMNNIGVAALMLPVVMDIARSTKTAPSRLLMPLAYGCLLGGLTTLIGTPPNLLISYALEEAGYRGFGLFDYSPLGVGATIAGIAFIALIGRHFLPKRDNIKDSRMESQKALETSYALEERTFLVKLRQGSRLSGRTLSECRLRAALGLNVLWIKRTGGGTIMDPGPDTLLREGDKLFVQGRKEALKAISEWKVILPLQGDIDTRKLMTYRLNICEAQLAEGSGLLHQKLSQAALQKHLKTNVLAIRKADRIIRHPFGETEIGPEDRLLLQGPPELIRNLEQQGQIREKRELDRKELEEVFRLHEELFIMEIAEDSELFDKASEQTQLGGAFGLSVLGIIRSGDDLHLPRPGESFLPGDRLLVQGNIENLELLKGLMDMELLSETSPGAQTLEDEDVQMAEVVLSPRSLMAGKTLQDINFRKKYGLTVLAIWREGKANRTNLHNYPLRFGEALLVYGRREKIDMLSSESDLILLTESTKPVFRTHKALTSALVMGGLLIPVLLGLIPLAISAVIGVAFMVLTGCLRMEEAYRAIEWRAVFLIAGMLPLGAAMEQTGAAAMIAGGVVNLLGDFGPWGIIVGLYLLTSLATLAIPPPALVVIMSPIALQAAETYLISPHSLMMVIAIAATASFFSLVAHPTNLLVMGPGGYRFSDYLKVGLPLALIVMATVLLLLPIFWPIGG